MQTTDQLAEAAGVTIRSASFDDLDAVVDVYNEAVIDGGATCDLSGVPASERAAWFAQRLEYLGLWVAEDAQGAIAGWTALSPYDPKPCFHRTASVSTYVARSWRGRDVGTALRAHLIEQARARGVRTLIARIWSTNESGTRLARRFGWDEAGYLREVVEHDGRFIDCRLFQLVL
jgi:L-amino acid N-acyltransferase YncA